MEKEHLTLKWGTLKSWEFNSEKGKELLEKYFKIGSSASAMLQKDTDEQKKIICDLIDIGTFKKVYLDWDGRYISKDEAKKYVMDYGKN